MSVSGFVVFCGFRADKLSLWSRLREVFLFKGIGLLRV